MYSGDARARRLFFVFTGRTLPKRGPDVAFVRHITVKWDGSNRLSQEECCKPEGEANGSAIVGEEGIGPALPPTVRIVIAMEFGPSRGAIEFRHTTRSRAGSLRGGLAQKLKSGPFIGNSPLPMPVACSDTMESLRSGQSTR